jgi:hypothetical protein
VGEAGPNLPYSLERIMIAKRCSNHTPHATSHTPHATRHTPHATRHTPHAIRRRRDRHCCRRMLPLPRAPRNDLFTRLVCERCFSTPSEEISGRPAPISTGIPEVRFAEGTKEVGGVDKPGRGDEGDADVRRKSNILFNATIQSISPAHKASDVVDASTGNSSRTIPPRLPTSLPPTSPPILYYDPRCIYRLGLQTQPSTRPYNASASLTSLYTCAPDQMWPTLLRTVMVAPWILVRSTMRALMTALLATAALQGLVAG